MPEDLLEKVKKMLRSVLISSKSGIKATRLQGEYRELAGTFIPHVKLGFPSLHDFLITLHDVVRIGQNQDHELTYYAIADSSTQHIQAMVAKQRPKKQAKKKAPSSYFRNYNFPSPRKPYKPKPQQRFNNFSVIMSALGKRVVYPQQQYQRKNPKQDTRIVVLKGSGDNKSVTSTGSGSYRNNDIPPRFANKIKKSSSSSDSTMYSNPLSSTSSVQRDGDGLKFATSQSGADTRIVVRKKSSDIEEPIRLQAESNLRKLLSVNPHGIHSTNISSLYKETFNEEFPPILLQKIVTSDANDCATVEKIRIGEEEKFILFPYDAHKEEVRSPKYPPPNIVYPEPVHATVDLHAMLKRGEDYKVTVCHFADCGEIYVQLIGEEDSMAKMLQLLKDAIGKLEPHHKLIKPGSFVITKAIFRAKVITIREQQVEIYNIDHTSSDVSYWVPVEQVQLMPPALAEFPEFKVTCSMHRLTGKGTNWQPESGNRFCELYMHRRLVMKPLAISTVQSLDSDVCCHEHSVIFYHNHFNINARLIHEETEHQISSTKNCCDPMKFQPGSFASLPDEEYCDLYIFNASCTVELEACVIGSGYSDELVKLENSMFEHYKNAKESLSLPEPPPIECVYAILSEETCVRGKLVSVEGEQGNVYLVDNGELDTVDLSSLRPLTEEFCKFPMQVVTVSLAGLDHQALSTHSSVLQTLNDTVVYKTCSARVVARFRTGTAKATNVVELIDTTGPTDVNINQLCRNQIFEDALFPTLPDVGCVSAVSISNVDVDSDCVFVRIAGEGMVALNTCISDIQSSFNEQRITPSKCATDVYPGKMCLVSLSGKIHRARVTQIVDGKTRGISVFLIDTGSYEQVSRGMLFKLEEENALSIPPQAVCCKLSECRDVVPCHDLTDDDFVTLKDAGERIESSPILMQIDKISESEEPHLVSLWINEEKKIRIVPASTSINLDKSADVSVQSLPEQPLSSSMKCELDSTQDLNNNHQGKSTTPPASVQACSFTSEPADASSVVPVDVPTNKELEKHCDALTSHNDENLFPVQVEKVISPDYLQIIAMKNVAARKILTYTLTSYYQKNPGVLLKAHEIAVGGMYAMYSDKESCWNRIKVVSKMSDDSTSVFISVYLVDHGKCRVCEASNLRKLAEKFLQIPGLVMTAKFAGIQPLDRKEMIWSEDVSKRLREMIEGKCYYAHVLKVTTEGALQGRKVLNLCLCDTSAAEDVWINDLLVDKWACAKYVE